MKATKEELVPHLECVIRFGPTERMAIQIGRFFCTEGQEMAVRTFKELFARNDQMSWLGKWLWITIREPEE